jgi:alpha-glucosidase
MDEAFPLFEKWGVKGVKVDFMDRDDQEMVAWYHRVAKKAAEHRLLVDFHGAFKPAGMMRYYPNVVAVEAAMSAEYLKWSMRVDATHNTVLPFTRGLAGPMDYTPGGFLNVTPEQFEPRNVNPMVPTTRAHQLALYVLFESAFQMLCDYPGAYRGQPEFAFLKAVPVVWDEARGLGGRPGEWAAVARRNGSTWWIGAIAGREEREVELPLDFLGEGNWSADFYADVSGQPAKTERGTTRVTRAAKLKVKLAAAGGYAASIHR